MVTKLWVIPELLVMPAPLIVRVLSLLAVLIVKALALELKIMLFTSISTLTERLVILEVSKVAVSAKPFGTVAGVQLVVLFHLLFGGDAFQVALPA